MVASTFARTLSARVKGSVHAEGEAVEQCSRDFGGFVREIPAIVLQPVAIDDICVAIELAKEAGTKIALRGAGHSQAGQTLITGGLVIDLRSMNRVLTPPQDEVILVEGGASWRDARRAASAASLAPCVLTTEHATTVGGTLSVGGVGSTSWLHGAQVDNVSYLDVVTGEGKLVRCNASSESELFDAVRAGLGQCGVIVRACLHLRKIETYVRTFRFVYDEAATFVEDVETIMRERRAGHLLAHFTESEKQAGRWRVVMTAGIEHAPGIQPDGSELRAGLGFDEELQPTDAALYDENNIFAFRYEDWFGPIAGRVFPWVDHFISWGQAREFIGAVLEGRFALVMRQGVQTVIPVAATEQPAPCLRPERSPGGEPLLLVGMFPKVPSPLGPVVGALMNGYADDVEARFGGKRYLYGFRRRLTPADWATHFGERWDWVRTMKAQYDPSSILTPNASWGPLR